MGGVNIDFRRLSAGHVLKPRFDNHLAGSTERPPTQEPWARDLHTGYITSIGTDDMTNTVSNDETHANDIANTKGRTACNVDGELFMHLHVSALMI